MKLLIITQKVSRKDSTLGFFHRWIEEISKKFEKVTVICLEKGENQLSPSIKILSLGKEGGVSRLKYIINFYKYIWRERENYDAVFVHMNQEYLLLGGWFWKLLGKKVFMWRNHYAGSFPTRIAGMFCKEVFYTSKFSYTARFKNSVMMPVGVDESSLMTDTKIERIPKSILFLGRLDSSKKPEILLKALGIVSSKGLNFSVSFVGGTSDPNSKYPEELANLAKTLKIQDRITFVGPVPNTETFKFYRSHEIFVNCSRSGMFDKTILKACASGCLVLATSKDFESLVGSEFSFPDDDYNELANRLTKFLSMSLAEKEKLITKLQSIIKNHSLPTLIEKLAEHIKQ
jgi:glycosyltransferase involved in cell wall biosynthesis